MSKRFAQKQFFYVLALSLIITLLGGGMALLHQGFQTTIPSHAASSDNVVGPPSLPAATVDTIFRRLGSPMTGIGHAVETAARAANIDDAFALAVWWTETNDGAAGVGLADHNPGSVRGSTGYPSAYDGYTIYPSYTAAVNYWFPMLKRVYINRGLTTVSAISHPYVGTSTSYLWADKVIALMQRYRGEAPPQAAVTAKPPATIPANVLRVEGALKQRAQSQAEPPVVAVQQQQATQAPSVVPSISTKQLVFLFGLLLALVLVLWARRNNWGHARRPQPVSNVWEQFQASRQQPSAFFGQHSLSGLLRTTEGLSVGSPSIGMLGITNPLQPAYSPPEVLSSQGLFMTNRTQYTPQRAPTFTGQLAFDAPAPIFTSQMSFDAPLPGYTQAERLLSFGPSLPGKQARVNTPIQNSLHRTRLQPASPGTSQFWSRSEAPGQRPQPQLAGIGAGGGRSNGLLSRYREMQAQERQLNYHPLTTAFASPQSSGARSPQNQV